MKKVIFTIISMFVFLTTNGQQINQSNNRYRGSDVLEKKQIVVKGFSLNDTKGVWSLEEAEITHKREDKEGNSRPDINLGHIWMKIE